ncbi:spindle pole body component 110-like [Dorcoceras hygrometricum]|uniref:Spindle pole body component 110-like n=1 Tax=Dorcoceras hygrometricum TaxID=472368 RepID=A0A2Z7A9J3_9LAMI|nr:spindle pole body component 110-like [Dorcoceras hygrometricum]
MQAALSKIPTENEELKSRSREMLYENQRLAGIISSWTRASSSLDKLHGAMKPTGDKSGLGYDGNDSSTTETSSTPQLARIKFRTMNFVKSRTDSLLRHKERMKHNVSWPMTLMRYSILKSRIHTREYCHNT